MPRPTRPLLLGAGVYALALAGVALWPTHVDDGFDAVGGTVVGRWLLGRGLSYSESYWLIEFGSNVLLYVPLGILAMMLTARARWWQATTLALAVSTVFELLQAVVLPDRTAAVADVVANTLGAMIGAGLFVAVRGGMRRTVVQPREL